MGKRINGRVVSSMKDEAQRVTSQVEKFKRRLEQKDEGIRDIVKKQEVKQKQTKQGHNEETIKKSLSDIGDIKIDTVSKPSKKKKVKKKDSSTQEKSRFFVNEVNVNNLQKPSFNVDNLKKVVFSKTTTTIYEVKANTTLYIEGNVNEQFDHMLMKISNGVYSTLFDVYLQCTRVGNNSISNLNSGLIVEAGKPVSDEVVVDKFNARSLRAMNHKSYMNIGPIYYSDEKVSIKEHIGSKFCYLIGTDEIELQVAQADGKEAMFENLISTLVVSVTRNNPLLPVLVIPDNVPFTLSDVFSMQRLLKNRKLKTSFKQTKKIKDIPKYNGSVGNLIVVKGNDSIAITTVMYYNFESNKMTLSLRHVK